MITKFDIKKGDFVTLPTNGARFDWPAKPEVRPALYDIYLYNSGSLESTIILEIREIVFKTPYICVIVMTEILGSDGSDEVFGELAKDKAGKQETITLTRCDKKLVASFFPNCLKVISLIVKNDDQMRAEYLSESKEDVIVIDFLKKVRFSWTPSRLKIGQKYKKGQILGTVAETQTNLQHKIAMERDGTLTSCIDTYSYLHLDTVYATVDGRQYTIKKMLQLRQDDLIKERSTTTYSTGIRAIDGCFPLGRSDPLICRVDSKEAADQVYQLLFNFKSCIKVVLVHEDKMYKIEELVRQAPNVVFVPFSGTNQGLIATYALRSVQYYKSQGIHSLLIVDDVEDLLSRLDNFVGKSRYDGFHRFALSGRANTYEFFDENSEFIRIFSSVTIVGLFLPKKAEDKKKDQEQLISFTKDSSMFVIWDFKKNSKLPFNFHYILSLRREGTEIHSLPQYIPLEQKKHVDQVAELLEKALCPVEEAKTDNTFALEKEWMILMKYYFFSQKEASTPEEKSHFFAEVMSTIQFKMTVMAKQNKKLDDINYDKVIVSLNELQNETDWNKTSEETRNLKHRILAVIEEVFGNPEPVKISFSSSETLLEFLGERGSKMEH